MMNHLDRKLASTLIISRLDKEYATDPVVHQCLTMSLNGEWPIDHALCECIKYLVARNKELAEAIIDKDWRYENQPHR